MIGDTAPIHRLEGPLDDAERAALVFSGALVIHGGLPELSSLTETADALVRRHFDEGEPALAQHRLAREPFLARAAAAQAEFGRDAAVSAAVAAALAACGLCLAETYWDRRTLRVLPSGEQHAGGQQSSTHQHRDTWGSNLYAQVNWWAPVYTLTEARTIAFYPRYWREPLANTSDGWSYRALLAARRAAGSKVCDYPTAPKALAPVDPAAEQRVVLQPGEMLCFSGAHLHVGVANESGRTRFSFETRTLSRSDLLAGRAAPNVDGFGVTPHTRWFRGVLDGAAVKEGVL